MKPEVISSTLIKMVSHKHLRKLLAKKIDDYIYTGLVRLLCLFDSGYVRHHTLYLCGQNSW